MSDRITHFRYRTSRTDIDAGDLLVESATHREYLIVSCRVINARKIDPANPHVYGLGLRLISDEITEQTPWLPEWVPSEYTVHEFIRDAPARRWRQR